MYLCSNADEDNTMTPAEQLDYDSAMKYLREHAIREGYPDYTPGRIARFVVRATVWYLNRPTKGRP